MSQETKGKRKKAAKSLPERIKSIVKNLYYTSETDAEIEPFVGQKTVSVDRESLIEQIGAATDSKVEERNFEDFFSRLTENQDWFGNEEKQTALKFSKLKELLQNELNDLKVFRIGETELDIYVVGLDSNSVLTGIKTKAVET